MLGTSLIPWVDESLLRALLVQGKGPPALRMETALLLRELE
jgi:hypothetical protein